MAAPKRDYDYLFKLVIIGDSGVGKSSLLLRFADDTFQEAYISTIGVDFRYRTVNVDGKVVKLQIWDTAGQERFRTITAAYYRGCDGIIMVYDVTNKESYTHVDHWFGEVTKYAMKTTSKMLIGNKIDAPDHRVTTAEGEKLASKLAIPFIETSAKTSENVEAAFVSLARSLISSSLDAANPKSDTVVIKPVSEKPKSGGGCC